jgi:hypothetical protein
LVDDDKVVDESKYSKLSDDEKWNGVDPKNYDGKYFFPYDKGGASDSEIGWLPKYFIPTGYFINWSRSAVNQMKKLDGFRHDGKEYYFRKGISFSHTGVYSPSFRFNCNAIFDTAGSCLFVEGVVLNNLICVLNSKLILYLFKSAINHTVNTSEDPLKAIPIMLFHSDEILAQLKSLVGKQKKNKSYDYASNEQIEIDRLVYAVYGLNIEDIEEVENWHVRRYPKLSNAQKENLRKLGKSDDYLVLYGLKKEKK